MTEQPMGFAVIPVWLLRDGSVDADLKTTYLMLSSYVGAEGVCWPSQERLAKDMGVSRATVQRYLYGLRDLGLVQIITQRTRSGRRNTYRLVGDRFGNASVQVSGGGITSEATPPAEEGGGITSDAMGGITGDARTTSSRTTSPEHTISEVLVSETPAAATVEPDTHPSRPIPGNWQPRPAWARRLMAEYPGLDVRESCSRFVMFHVAKQDTSRSWEAALRLWVSQDHERWRERQGTDDLGVPMGQRTSSHTAPQPGDPDYVDPDSFHRAAVEAATRRPPRHQQKEQS